MAEMKKPAAAKESAPRQNASQQASRQSARQTAESLANAHAEIEKLKASNERMSQEMQILGGFGTLINVLQNGIGNVVDELAPLKDMSPAQTAEPLEPRVAARLRSLERSLDRVRSDSYTIPFTELDVGFLHDSPASVETEYPAPEYPQNPYLDTQYPEQYSDNGFHDETGTGRRTGAAS
jgi:hypothetical protein